MDVASSLDSGVETSSNHGQKIVKALYDYIAAPDGSSIRYLSFKNGDLMEATIDDGDWWWARCMETGNTGYIPRTYVSPISGPRLFDWYHGTVTYKDANELLMAPGNDSGTFLIRESETQPGMYVLAVLHEDAQKNRLVRQYRVTNTDDGGCCIRKTELFKSFEDMINTYTKAEGLCCRLTTACPRQSRETYDPSTDETTDSLETPRSDIELTTLLGSGNFGEIWKGEWKGLIDVAVTAIKSGTLSAEHVCELVSVMKKLRHPRILTLYAVCTLEEPMYIVCELMTGGSLLSHLRERRNEPIPIDDLINIAAKIADGMQHVEKEQCTHPDLAARNIFVGQNLECIKIGNFAQLHDERSGEVKLAVKWTAPETLLSAKFTIKSNVWTFGILLVELTNGGAIPYPGLTNHNVIEMTSNGYRHPRPPRCPDALYQIMLDCWNKDPPFRPTFEHLFQTLDDFWISVEPQLHYVDSHCGVSSSVQKPSSTDNLPVQDRLPLPVLAPHIGNYSIVKTIGSGNFATVKLAKHLPTGRMVAIKIIDKTKFKPSGHQMMCREVKAMKNLDHPNIVKLFEVMETTKTMYLVMEYASGGELFDYLLSYGRMKEGEARTKFRQIVSAVHYCHKKNIVHRDLKAENLLLDHDLNIKIVDFGFSNEFSVSGKLSTFCGSPPYAAPELFQGKKYVGPEVDVWSLGVILFVMVTGSLPFDGNDLKELRKKVLKGKFKIPFYLPTNCEKLLRKILVLNPTKRVTLEAAMKDQWLTVEAELKPHTERAHSLDDNRIESAMRLGYTREQIEKSLNEQRYDGICAAYHLFSLPAPSD